jgi:hypothetical protein
MNLNGDVRYQIRKEAVMISFKVLVRHYLAILRERILKRVLRQRSGDFDGKENVDVR